MLSFKRGLALLLGLFFSTFSLGTSGLMGLAQAQDVPEAPKEEAYPYEVRTFIITGYYSPLPGQAKYATGSYESDLRLNGNGTHGADGTPVFPGMVAAPKAYPFGTKLYLPGIGLVSVHDRGGAIQVAGSRGNAYDRLDIWMGAGDEGLQRALHWGKRTVDALVYGLQPELKEAVSFEANFSPSNFVDQYVLSPLEFPHDLDLGVNTDEVQKMEKYLKDWGYFNDTPDSFYGENTAQALFEFQSEFDLVSSADELGAGHFGPATRRQFDALIKNPSKAQNLIAEKRGANLLTRYADLNETPRFFESTLDLGSSGDEVRHLQEELNRLGYLRLQPTAYFGASTQHAVFKFQQSQGLVSSMQDSGAGLMGPNTREALNHLVRARYQTKTALAFQREEVSSGRKVVTIPAAMTVARKDED